MSALGVLVGESRDQYVARLESELADAHDEIKELQSDAETEERCLDALRTLYGGFERELDFLREQLTELSQQIASPSAPRTRGQMRRLIDGLLRREDWRNLTWR